MLYKGYTVQHDCTPYGEDNGTGKLKKGKEKNQAYNPRPLCGLSRTIDDHSSSTTICTINWGIIDRSTGVSLNRCVPDAVLSPLSPLANAITFGLILNNGSRHTCILSSFWRLGYAGNSDAV